MINAAITVDSSILIKYALTSSLTGSKRNTSLNFFQENNNVFLFISINGNLNSLNPLKRNRYLTKNSTPLPEESLEVGRSRRNVPGILTIIKTIYRMFKP